ncbi:MAG TPA: hypothetical protein VMS17_23060 [Gemmataceae bacterium]|nr:hypothetical protein [Gemmataceae bacterium]
MRAPDDVVQLEMGWRLRAAIGMLADTSSTSRLTASCEYVGP